MSQSSMTCAQSALTISPESRASSEGSHVRTYRAPEQARALLEAAADCGLNLPGSSWSCDPSGSWSRMSAPEQSDGSMTYVLPWNSTAMKRYRSQSQQKMLALLTSEEESSSLRGTLATPCARDAKGSPGKSTSKGGRSLARERYMLPTPSAERYGTGNNGCPHDGREEYATRGKPSLYTLASRDMLPTPVSSDWKSGHVSGDTLGKNSRPLREVILLPTPVAGDSKAAGSRRKAGSKARPGVSLTDVVVHGRTVHGEQHGDRSASGHLSPLFVEWMMGLPLNWTDPGCVR